MSFDSDAQRKAFFANQGSRHVSSRSVRNSSIPNNTANSKNKMIVNKTELEIYGTLEETHKYDDLMRALEYERKSLVFRNMPGEDQMIFVKKMRKLQKLRIKAMNDQRDFKDIDTGQVWRSEGREAGIVTAIQAMRKTPNDRVKVRKELGNEKERAEREMKKGEKMDDDGEHSDYYEGYEFGILDALMVLR